MCQSIYCNSKKCQKMHTADKHISGFCGLGTFYKLSLSELSIKTTQWERKQMQIQSSQVNTCDQEYLDNPT